MDLRASLNIIQRSPNEGRVCSISSLIGALIAAERVHGFIWKSYPVLVGDPTPQGVGAGLVVAVSVDARVRNYSFCEPLWCWRRADWIVVTVRWGWYAMTSRRSKLEGSLMGVLAFGG